MKTLINLHDCEVFLHLVVLICTILTLSACGLAATPTPTQTSAPTLVQTATPAPTETSTPTSVPTATSTLTPTSAPLDLVKNYEIAVNNHDLNGLMSLLTDSITFYIVDWDDSFYSRDAVQNGYGFLFGIHMDIHLSDCKVENDIITCQLTYAEDCLRSAGVNEATFTAIFTLDSGKIKQITWHDSIANSPTAQTYDAFEKNFFTWYGKTYPDEWQRMSASATAFWQPENGPLYDKRCLEYAVTLK